MSEESKNRKPITLSGYSFIALWVLIIVFVSFIAGYHIFSLISQMRLDASTYPQMYIDNSSINFKPDSYEDIRRNVVWNSTEVLVGIYVDHIKELNFKDSLWNPDFYIWFIWNGDNISPGNNFQVINGYINEDDKFMHDCSPLNESPRYEVYEISCDITKDFDINLYPFDNQILMIKIEDVLDDETELIYKADRRNSTISDRVNLTGFKIIDYNSTVMSNIYKTNFGYPSENIHDYSTYSQYNFIMLLQRSDKFLLFLKLFLGLFVAVCVSILAFFIEPKWPARFGVQIGGLFAAITNNYIVSFQLPITGTVTLIGLIHLIGIATIFLTIIQSVISTYIYSRTNAYSLSELFDKASFITFMLIFSIIITAIIQSVIHL